MIYFAWVSSADTTFSSAVHRVDEDVFSFTVDHGEGDFPSLTVEIRNPRVGLLGVARSRWCWLSYGDGTTVTPLFFGRLVGVPERASEEIVTLTFIARPPNYTTIKQGVAEGLRVLPWFDPVWIGTDRRSDPDVALEARTALYHIDRLSLAVTVSDIVAGEDGTVNIGGNYYRDSLDMRYTQIPARAVRVNAEMTWTQEAEGAIDISRPICDAFGEAGTTLTNRISTFTGEGLLRDWPRTGQNIGAGWRVGPVSLPRVDGVNVVPRGDIANTLVNRVYFPEWVVEPTMILDYEANRGRAEVCRFSIASTTQEMIADNDDEDVIELDFASSAAAEPIGGVIPIGDLRRRTWFQTDRGRDSLRYLMLMARARLIAQARAVEIEVDIPFATAITLSCRRSATLADARIPGGTATGKIVRYAFGLSGETGALEGSLTIACTIGTGGTITPIEADPGYADTGWVDLGYQVNIGGEELLTTGDMAFTHFGGTEINDDGIDFFNLTGAQVVQECTVINGPTAQRAVIQTQTITPQQAIDLLNQSFTQVELTLFPVSGVSFLTEYDLGDVRLAIPRTINLEAA